ncbi:MAG: MauE/DoxX family redox-associated membrane protein [Chloroflexota bacterium]
MRGRYWVALGCSLALGLVFVTSGIGKLLGQSAFLLNVASLAFLPRLFVDVVTRWLPWGELVLGVLLLTGVVIQLTGLLSAILAGALIFHNAWMIGVGLGYQPCGCLGIFERIFQGKLSSAGALYVDIALLVLALAIYFASSGKFLDWRPWFMRRPRPAATPAALSGPAATPPSTT